MTMSKVFHDKIEISMPGGFRKEFYSNLLEGGPARAWRMNWIQV
jgi:hypothetical protein